jgi:hypothetical protein
VNWTRRGSVFPAIPKWALDTIPGTRGIWAPDVSYFNGQYRLYYAVSTFGSNHSVIGLATNAALDPAAPNYAWQDQGLVIGSNTFDKYNCIDPNHFVSFRMNIAGDPTARDPNNLAYDFWGLRDAVDIWCPLFAFFDEASAKAARERGSDIWTYTALCQKAPPYHPQFAQVSGQPTLFWQIDFPAMNYRISLWTMWRYGIKGLLYWSTVYWGGPERDVWTDPGFRNRYNGDGFLFYPGIEAGIQGPVTSIRLKVLREGLEDYAYFTLLEKLGDKAFSSEEVSKIGSSWWKWDDAPEHLYQVRAALAGRIMEKQQSQSH